MPEDPVGARHAPDDGRLLPAPVAYGQVDIAAGRVLLGATSWADRSLVSSGTFYPKRSMTARARLGYYASRFPLAEIATTFRFPPTPDVSAQWAERTPPGFTFDVRAWSLLSGAPTLPDSLWPDMQDTVREQSRDLRRLYPAHLSAEAYEECFARFAHALGPLQAAGRVGVVILQYPGWFSPRPEAWAELALLPSRLPGFRLAVELHNAKWFEGDACEGTLEWLEERDLGLVCIDGPLDGPRALPLVAASTTDVAVVRLVGRRHDEGHPWTSPYRYSPAELRAWVPRLEALASSASEVHVLMDNWGGSDAVDNAGELAALLRDPQVSR